MSESKYRSTPLETEKMPPGVPYIVGNEAAERFSFYGMKAILAIFMTKYLWLMNDKAGTKMTDAAATEYQHWFITAVYFTPFLGALIADIFWGKYRTIIYLSLVYCAGHGALAFMGITGSAGWWLFAGLALITFGAGGIKPCVSAHVGDQFGNKNQHLLTRVFNWFYWSINLGAAISSIMTPWILDWFGPHWAFGVPGVLMAIATLLFWMGRKKFVHIPAGGGQAARAIFSKAGLRVFLKLSTIFIFIAMFWALFDQHSSSWIIQVDDMNRHWLGIEWLPSQIQTLNPILILTFIPLFTYVIYPAISKFFPLTPLRKMGIGFFVMFVGWLVISFAQERIDAGHEVSFGWQALGYALMTAAEIMISIVGLEFSYTQAPKAMKSMVMALFLLSVAAGNFLTASFNHLIQIEDELKRADDLAKKRGVNEVTLVGFDGQDGTKDDIVVTYDRDFGREKVNYADKDLINELAKKVEAWAEDHDMTIPRGDDAKAIFDGKIDSFGNPIQYKIVSSRRCRIFSLGGDGELNTKFDCGVRVEFKAPEKKAEGGVFDSLTPEEKWLVRRMRELEVEDLPVESDKNHFVGGQAKIEGASYFWTFTWLMLGTAVIFVFVAMGYKTKEDEA